MKYTLPIFICALLLILCANNVFAANWRQGKKVFKKSCMSCHSRDGSAKRIKINKKTESEWNKFLDSGILAHHSDLWSNVTNEQKTHLAAYFRKYAKNLDEDYMGYPVRKLSEEEIREEAKKEREINDKKMTCNDGDAASCNWVGEKYRYRNEKTSVRYFESACNYGLGEGCLSAGKMFTFSDEIKNVNLGSKYFDKGCELNNTRSCDRVLYRYEDMGNVEMAHKYALKGCNELKSISGCDRLGMYHYQKKTKRTDDLFRSIYYFEKACSRATAKSLDACYYHKEIAAKLKEAGRFSGYEKFEAKLIMEHGGS